MREQDAHEICTYFDERVRPFFDHRVSQPHLIVYPKRSPEGPEAHVLIPIDGAKTARDVFARLVSEMGFAAQLPIPLERSEISCSLEMFKPEELKLRARPGMMWGLSVSSRPFVKLPEVEAFIAEDLLADLDETKYGPDAVETYDFDLPFKDSQSAQPQSEAEMNPFVEELRGLTRAVVTYLTKQKDGRSKLVSPYTLPLPNNGHVHIVAVHGFTTSYAATTFAREVVEQVGRVRAVSLTDLQAPAVDFSLRWNKRFVVSFLEAVRNKHP